MIAPPATLPVGIIGLGIIGSMVTRGLARSGRKVLAYDICEDAADSLPAERTASPKEMAPHCDVVLVAVIDETQAHAVLLEPQGLVHAARPGAVAVLLSTISVTVLRELAAECAPHGLTLLDCGVTMGRPDAAEHGPVCMVGGHAAQIASTMPVLDTFAKEVVHCGPLGAGMVTRIARNVITYGTWTVLADAVRIADSASVPAATLLAAVDVSDPECSTTFRWLRMLLDGTQVTPERATRTGNLLDKDLVAAQELARIHCLDTDLLDLMRTRSPATPPTPTRKTESMIDDDPIQRGRDVMGQVYGAAFAAALPDPSSPAQLETMTHLFPEIWARTGLDVRDRRLVVMGIVAMLGRGDLMETQAYGALVNHELTPEQLDEIVLQIHYYAGWPNGTQARAGAEAAVRRFRSDIAEGDGS